MRFRNDQFVPILGYGDMVQGNITIKKVYYVKGLNHYLFSVSQFCDADLEVSFRKSTCYARDLKENDLLIGSRRTDLLMRRVMDPNSSLGKICLGEDVVVISSDKVEGSGDWNSLKFQDTANSRKKKERKAMAFYQMETEEVSDRFVAP
ncbi:hypothetical protein Tco_0343910 [Tanacetum coccineum]